MIEWINIENKLPEKEGYYHCLCRYFNKPIKCRFIKEKKRVFKKKGIYKYRPSIFIHKKRIPYVVYWKRK